MFKMEVLTSCIDYLVATHYKLNPTYERSKLTINLSITDGPTYPKCRKALFVLNNNIMGKYKVVLAIRNLISIFVLLKN